MSTRFKVLLAAVITLLIAGAAVGMMLVHREGTQPAQGSAPAEKRRLLIGLSLHMTTDDYGRFMSQAFKDTLGAAKVDYVITDAQHSGQQQREDIERHIARRVDALVIVPTDDQLITQETNKAADQGIPIIAVTAMPGSRVTTTILGRDRDNGFDAGTILAKKLGGTGKVMVLNTPTDLTRLNLRHEGFRDAIRDTGLEIVATKRSISKEGCMAAVEEVLREHPDLKGIYAPFGTALIGAASAIRARDRKDIVITGIDADFEVLKLIQEGWIAATLAQYPSEHGRLAAEAALRILHGEPLVPSVDAPFKIVTQENAAAMAQELWGRELR
ncbi:sugar ABC transporter substrate-binding protein [Hyalangium versicolor]|uniref:sugar ABC transporter substrate-binding protein n=1 Tax=Hyalangium versicolor TaxID=2861190 RepID=UPI001CCAF4D5|nr:sugar ABC transporter substrate-binding protein [Hyalangium versicolor]